MAPSYFSIDSAAQGQKEGTQKALGFTSSLWRHQKSLLAVSNYRTLDLRLAFVHTFF